MFRTISKVIFPCLVAASLTVGGFALAGQGQKHPKNEGLIGAALHEVELRPDQRTSVEQIASEARAARAPVREAGVALRTALADQIKNDALDSAALAPKVALVADAASKTRAAEDVEIDKLHGILDASQRAALAGKLEASNPKANRHELGRLSKELGLSPEQRKQIATLLKDQRAGRTEERAQAKAKERSALEAFKREDFQMEKFRPASEARADTVREENERISVLKKIADVLTPDQRAKLAAAVAKGARI
jgi:Spy/CpxP family protein refolding chaperone